MSSSISTSGWSMKSRVSIFCLLGLISVGAVAEPEEAPSMELLEFLAGLETEGGEQVDTVQLLESDSLLRPTDSTESKDDE